MLLRRIDHSVHSVSAVQASASPAHTNSTVVCPAPRATAALLTAALQMPAAIVSSKGGGRVTRAAAPATSSFSGGGELAAKGGFSFGSGGGGGGGSSDISRYRLHVEPAAAASATAVTASKVAGLQISSSNPSKSADVAATGGSNRLKPAPPHAWMDVAGSPELYLFALALKVIRFLGCAGDGARSAGGSGGDDVAELKERLARWMHL